MPTPTSFDNCRCGSEKSCSITMSFRGSAATVGISWYCVQIFNILAGDCHVADRLLAMTEEGGSFFLSHATIPPYSGMLFFAVTTYYGQKKALRRMPEGLGWFMGLLLHYAFCILHYLARARYRKVTAWARLQLPLMPKVPSPMPLVTPFSTAQLMGASYHMPATTSVKSLPVVAAGWSR